MKKIIRILKRRVVMGTLIIFVALVVLGAIFATGIIALIPPMWVSWWIYCFFTRNRGQYKGDEYETLPEWKRNPQS